MSQELNGTLTNSADLVGTFGNTGGGGTTNYNDLTNKPQINGVELQGNKTTSNLNISYNDLTNKPTIPAAQVNSDWNSTSGVSEILNKPSLATVATSGSYDDLTDKPTIPAAQVNSDWNSVSGVSEILNKPSLATVATSGSYDDLTNKPTIPAAQVNSDWNSTSGVSEILNKPSLATVATSGSYDDLTNKPIITSVKYEEINVTLDSTGEGTLFTTNKYVVGIKDIPSDSLYVGYIVYFSGPQTKCKSFSRSAIAFTSQGIVSTTRKIGVYYLDNISTT